MRSTTNHPPGQPARGNCVIPEAAARPSPLASRSSAARVSPRIPLASVPRQRLQGLAAWKGTCKHHLREPCSRPSSSLPERSCWAAVTVRRPRRAGSQATTDSNGRQATWPWPPRRPPPRLRMSPAPAPIRSSTASRSMEPAARRRAHRLRPSRSPHRYRSLRPHRHRFPNLRRRLHPDRQRAPLLHLLLHLLLHPRLDRRRNLPPLQAPPRRLPRRLPLRPRLSPHLSPHLSLRRNQHPRRLLSRLLSRFLLQLLRRLPGRRRHPRRSLRSLPNRRPPRHRPPTGSRSPASTHRRRVIRTSRPVSMVPGPICAMSSRREALPTASTIPCGNGRRARRPGLAGSASPGSFPTGIPATASSAGAIRH